MPTYLSKIDNSLLPGFTNRGVEMRVETDFKVNFQIAREQK